MMNEFSTVFKQKKVCVLVPTYNNGQTLKQVLRDVSEYTDQVVVVNDGSTDTTSEILKEFNHLSIINFPSNKGKGYALRMGFKKAVELGYDYAVTIDSDGQHYADDLPVFLKKLEDHPASIIIGARNMEHASIPGKSSFGHKFSNFWFWVEAGYRVNDTQSGYRLYPVKLLNDFTFITRKYEFEIEVLIRASWSGIEVTDTPIKVFYAEKGKRISHFRPFWDFTRISILNTFLVIIALLYIKPRDFLFGIKKKTSDDNS